jgi:hypothetical protein
MTAQQPNVSCYFHCEGFFDIQPARMHYNCQPTRVDIQIIGLQKSCNFADTPELFCYIA